MRSAKEMTVLRDAVEKTRDNVSIALGRLDWILNEMRNFKSKPFKGITGFARHYGYSRQHVLFVLKGMRTSAPVLKDWAEWQKKQAAAK